MKFACCYVLFFVCFCVFAVATNEGVPCKCFSFSILDRCDATPECAEVSVIWVFDVFSFGGSCWNELMSRDLFVFTATSGPKACT